MKWQRKKKNGGATEYWETIADALAALLLIILLILMLLLLYIARAKENDNLNNNPEPTPIVYDVSHDNDDSNWNDGWSGWHDHDYDYNNGGGDNDERIPQTTPQPDFDEPSRGKAAVLVRVIDAETERLIREEGIRFELYSDNGAQQRLFSYYPVKVEYSSFITTENGTFYFPEKLLLDNYYLHETTEPSGYDASTDVAFFIGSDYDWQEPYSVEIRLYPSRNVICVQLNDAKSGEAIPNGSFDVIADGDIVTMDGTVRYTDGQVVDQIHCDENGFGSSIELYLGRYILKEAEIPQFYAASEQLTYTRTEKKIGDELSEAIEIQFQKTEFVFFVVDELYNDLPVQNACFVVYEDGLEREKLLSDSNGTISVIDLNKNTQYRVVQIGNDNKYCPDNNEYSFYVDENGRIDGQVTATEQIVNRTLRLSITVKDALLPGNTDTRNITMYNADGEIVASWNTNGTAYVVDGLSVGFYEIQVNGKTVKEVEIKNTAQLQTDTISIWTSTSIVIMIIICSVLIGCTVAIVLYSVKNKRRKGVISDE